MHSRHGLREVRLGRGLTRHLNQRNASQTLRHRTLLNRSNSALDSLHTRKGAGSKPAPSHSRALKFYLSSKIRIAAAIVVVQRPFLSPTADCVTFAVGTILSGIGRLFFFSAP